MSQYIGVTGFTSPKQVQEVYNETNISRFKDGPLLMIGVLASAKTLCGTAVESKRYPRVGAIAAIFNGTEKIRHNCFNLIHYNSRARGKELTSELLYIRELGGKHCDGLQLNMSLPAAQVLEDYRKKYPYDSTVLQVNHSVFELVENDPKKLARVVKEFYGWGLCTHVLLDKSGGKGKMVDLEEMEPYLDALTQAGINELGIAGGLSARNVGSLDWLFERYPHLSTDAEGTLHSGENKDVFEPAHASEYVNAVLGVLRSVE